MSAEHEHELVLLAFGDVSGEDLPEGPLAVFRGGIDAIRAVAPMFRKPVDARLIANAPTLQAQRDELLAALKDICDVGADRYDMDMGEEGSRVLDRARALIERIERGGK